MKEFPVFMKNPANLIEKTAQYTEGIEGYVFNGADGSQMAFWTCYKDKETIEHAHDYDEYFVVVEGQYTVIVNNKETLISVGQEYHVPKGTLHSGRSVAGTRTIHCFGGKRV
ncbi:MAG: cupin domain-containing protein [Rubrobacteridae bacterium]|nr:cupin domain-containing protein [Rubrobacteridae bacterium]